MVAGGTCNGVWPLWHLAGSRCFHLWEGDTVKEGFWQLENPQTPCTPPKALMAEQVPAGGHRALTWRHRVCCGSLILGGVSKQESQPQADCAHSHLLGELEQGCAPGWFFMLGVLGAPVPPVQGPAEPLWSSGPHQLSQGPSCSLPLLPSSRWCC